MTPAALKSHTYRDLAQMAKKHGVPGWHAMRKDQLVRALAKAVQKKSAGRSSSSRTKRGKELSAAKKSLVRKQISQLQAKLERAKNLSAAADGRSIGDTKDRLVVMVRDPYWLHAYWELSRQGVARVQAAMGQNWHTARPMLRLFEVSSDGVSTTSDIHIRSIEIHGGVNNWYIDLPETGKSHRLDIGYQASDGSFQTITRSNVVTTPSAAVRDADENWIDVAENFDRIYALSGGYSPEGGSQELRELLEERLRRPMGSPVGARYGAGAAAPMQRPGEFHFEADAEMIVYGTTAPGAQVMMMGEPVQLREDGTFTVRLSMPERRQVIPLVSSSADGVEQRTIVLAVERNTKRMETVFRDATL